MSSSHTRNKSLAFAAVLVAIFAQLTSTSASDSSPTSSASILVSAHASEAFVSAGDMFTLSCAVRLTGLSQQAAAAYSTVAPPPPAAPKWSWPPFSAAVGPRAMASASSGRTADETRRSRSRRSIRRRKCGLLPSLCVGYDENYNFTESAQKYMKSLASITPPPESVFYQPLWKPMAQTPRPSRQRSEPIERPTRKPPSYVNVSVVNGRTELVRVRVWARNVWMHDERLTMDVIFPVEAERMRVLPQFTSMDRARIDEFEIEFQVNNVRITDSQRYRCHVTDGRQSNVSDTFVRVVPLGQSDLRGFGEQVERSSTFGHYTAFLVTAVVCALNLACLLLGVCVVRHLRSKRSRRNAPVVFQMAADLQREPLVCRAGLRSEHSTGRQGPLAPPSLHVPNPDVRAVPESELPPPPDYSALPAPAAPAPIRQSESQSVIVPQCHCSTGASENQNQQQQLQQHLLLLVPPPYSEVDRTKDEQEA